MDPAPARFLTGAYLVPERVPDDRYPFNLPCVAGLDLRFDRAVTIFVGENGSGKSTVLQALAVLSRLPAGGGGRAQLGVDHSVPTDLSARLASAMRPVVRQHAPQAWYFRADLSTHFASALARAGGHHAYARDRDALFASRPLHTLSHGEAFLATVHNRARQGLLFFDEPESALSPQRQLTLMSLLARAVAAGNTQVILATHSPLLLTFPGASLLAFGEDGVRPTTLEETSHYQITRGLLECPERYWKHLLQAPG